MRSAQHRHDQAGISIVPDIRGQNIVRITLTRSKLAPPLLPAYAVALDRHRHGMPAVLQHNLCVVHAPSGYGKSTLCTDWHHQFAAQNCRVGWVSLDSEDDDSARAIAYIMETARACFVKQSPDSDSDAVFYDGLIPPISAATSFINSIHDSGEPFILFLDDVDRLSDPRILQFLNYVLLHCPANLHLVLTYQTQPALPLAHLDHRGMLLRIGVEQLRLSDDEAETMLHDIGAILDREQVRRLNEAMGGWATGLRIGSAAFRNNRDALFDIGLVTHGSLWLSDYLDENILGHLQPQYRDFLTRIAIVETISSELAEALTGAKDAHDMLVWLSDQNLFIQRINARDTSFRIYPVFREFLQGKLRDESTKFIKDLHRRASRWFAEQGKISEAITHALEAGDDEEATELITQAAMPMVEHSDLLPLLSLIARLPEKLVADRIPLRLAEAWALTLCLRPQARPLLDALRVQVEDIKDNKLRQKFLQELAGIEAAFLAVIEDRVDAAIVEGHSCLPGITEDGSFVDRSILNATAYCEMSRGNHQEMHALLRRIDLFNQKKEQSLPTAYRNCIAGSSYRIQGQLAEAERTFRTGFELAERRAGPQSASAALLSVFVARCLYERNECTQAVALLEERMPIIVEACYHEAVIQAYMILIRTAAKQGKIDEAAALIERAELLGYERGWQRLLASCFVERSRLGLPQIMDSEELLPVAEEEQAIAEPMSLRARCFAILAEARVYEAIDASDRPRLNQIAERLAKLADSNNDWELRLKSTLFMILPQLSGRCGRMVDIDTVTLLNQAAQNGYERTIIDVLEVTGVGSMAGITSGAFSPNSFLSLVQLVDQSREYNHSATSEQHRSGVTVFSILTSREIDVLTAVGNGDSNKEIARTLHLTPETVKWHVKNVMRKLGAESRAEAVRNAATLGLALAAE